MRQKFKLQYFMILVFLAILLFINPETVFAGNPRGGGTSQTGGVTIENAEDMDKNNSTGSKEILASSRDVNAKFVHNGFKADMAAEAFGGAGSGAANGLSMVVSYPDIIMFREVTQDGKTKRMSRYDVLGYMYFYTSSAHCDEEIGYYIDYMNNDVMPYYYSESDSDGEVMFAIPAYTMYLPISNINTGSGSVYGQFLGSFKATHDKKSDLISVLNIITNNGQTDQNVEDWSGVAGQKSILCGNEGEKAIISGSNAYLLMFANAGMAENTWNSIGEDYIKTSQGKTYPIRKEVIVNGFASLANQWKGYNTVIKGNPEKINDYYGFLGFKNNGEELGTQSGFASKGNNSRLWKETNGGSILKVETMFRNVWQNFQPYQQGSKNRLRLTTPAALNNLFSIAKGSGSTGISDRPINVSGVNCVSRYEWGCQAGHLGATIDVWFPRDVTPEKQDEPAGIVERKLPGSQGQLASHKFTKHFGSYATDYWGSVDEEERITSTIVMLESDPWYVGAIAKKSARVKNILKTTDYLGAVKALNELGKKDREKWAECILLIGQYITQNSRTTEFCSSGWSSESAFTNGNYYCVESYGMAIIYTAPPVHKEELLISNSYNDNNSDLVSLSEYSSETSTGTNNPQARNVIDWITPSNDVASVVGEGYDKLTTAASGGKGALPDNVGVTYRDGSFKQFDIRTALTGYGDKTLKTGQSNIFDMQKQLSESDRNNFVKDNANNSSSGVFRTFVFVGRIPEASEKRKVTINDMKVGVSALFNRFSINGTTDDNWNPSEDENYSSRFAIHDSLQSDLGNAQSILKSVLTGFSMDYNVNVFQNYLFSSNNYTRNNLKITVNAKPVAILDIGAGQLEKYNTNEYVEKGPKATGYGFTGSWVKTSDKNREVKPGSVVCYASDFTIPGKKSAEAEIKSNYTSSTLTSLLSTGEWYEKYGVVLIADLSYDLLPGEGKTANEIWESINPNCSNDFVKQRIKAPLRSNIFFTYARAYSEDGKLNEIYSQNNTLYLDGTLPYMIAEHGDGPKACKFNVNLNDYSSQNDATKFDINRFGVVAKWRVVTVGQDVSSLNHSDYNYVNYSNDFIPAIGDEKDRKITADSENGGGRSKDLELNSLRSVNSLNPNEDFVNQGKDGDIKLTVPQTEANQYREDWEIITLHVESIPKDNAVVDLILVRGGKVIGTPGICRGGEENRAQLLEKSGLSGYTIYAVVERNLPSRKWAEKVGNKKYGSPTLGLDIDADNSSIKMNIDTPNYTGSLFGTRWRSAVSINDFDDAKEIIAYKVPISGSLDSLTVTAHYRDGFNGINTDHEDMDMTNNNWQESWNDEPAPDFEVEILSQQDDVLDQRGSGGCTGGGTSSRPSAKKVSPVYTIRVTQSNPEYKSSFRVPVKVSLEGFDVKAGGGFNGEGIVYWSGSGVAEESYTVSFQPRTFEYQAWSSGNHTFRFSASINLDPKTEQKEVVMENNYKDTHFTVNLSYIPKPSSKCTVPCSDIDIKSQDCKTRKGIGNQYRWNVKFRWTQCHPTQTTSVNVFVAHYWVPVFVSDGNGGSVFSHMAEVCPCYCEPGYAPGPNNEVRLWRTDLGYSLYYEVHTMDIYCKSSAHGTRSIGGGSTTVYTGETFIFWFDARYDSDRGSMPEAKYSPNSQPYDTPNGGSGHKQPCNWLHREPNPVNVPGPYHVRIKIQGTSHYDQDREWTHAQQILAYGLVNKWYRWQPVPDVIYVQKENHDEDIYLEISSYAFRGHWRDTELSVDGTGYSSPGYGWGSVTQHCFCDTLSAMIYIRGSKYGISSSQNIFLDETSTSYEADNKIGNSEIGGDNFVDNQDTYVY